jgi:chaperonin GroES
MTIQPLYDKVFVRPYNPRVSTGSIFLPETIHDRKDVGTVVAAGPGKLRKDGSLQALGVEQGDTVVFPLSQARRVTVDGEDLFLIDSRHLLAVVEGW